MTRDLSNLPAAGAATGSPGFYADFAGLAALKRGAKEQDPQALREAARQFESIFAKMMLSSMREASFGDSLFGSDQQDFYRGLFDDQLALELTKGRGLGLADMLVQQLTRAGLVAPPSDGAATKIGEQAGVSAQPGAVGETGASSALPTRRSLNPVAPANAEVSAHARTALESLSTTPHAQPAEATSATTWRPASREEFIRDLWPAAEAAGRELGVDPRALLAHAALETGWGRSIPSDPAGRSSFNLFGTKAGGAWSGPAVGARTLEFEDGLPVRRQQSFRAYDSPAASFADYVELIRDNPRYAAARGTGSDVAAFAQALQSGGYATDPDYARKLVAVAQTLSDSGAMLKTADARPITARIPTL